LQFDKFLKNYVSSENVNAIVRLACFGQLPLRAWFHPEVASKGIEVPDYYFSFFDIKKEYSKFIAKNKGTVMASSENCMEDILSSVLFFKP
jgi:epithelial splicing regulatory protein 1/2